MKISLVSIPVEDPVEAHEIYTSKLGFITKQFDAEARLAIVVSPEDPNGTAILLEPCQGTFYENFQKSAFESNLPILILESENAVSTMEKLKSTGVKIRPDLEKPEWGVKNLFEDGCGNILMIDELSS